MVTIHQSQTYPINPPSASPPLTLAEMWQVMLLKCRKPELFVAPMSSSHVIEETPTFMKRTITMKTDADLPHGEQTEELQIRAPWKIDFFNLSTGAFVNNTISQGTDEEDLYLTFYFEWPYPDLIEGSEEAREMEGKLWGMARAVVKHTIDYAREMKREGKLGKGEGH
ncbi:hypothetical protein N7G274_004601 [Stereocaulon virgatum]|uniref:DUF1857-domain-containing protein n=1 Tax=Stereocaulon virgatum TaxID=373712 RepID=A0ABR4ADA4_9LECA